MAEAVKAIIKPIQKEHSCTKPVARIFVKPIVVQAAPSVVKMEVTSSSGAPSSQAAQAAPQTTKGMEGKVVAITNGLLRDKKDTTKIIKVNCACNMRCTVHYMHYMHCAVLLDAVSLN